MWRRGDVARVGARSGRRGGRCGSAFGRPPRAWRRRVLPTDPALWVARQALWEAVQPPAAGIAATAAYTDGSVVDGRDPLLARAVCAAVLVDVAGAVVASAAAGVAGRQTAPRAELSVAVWVAEGSAGPVPLVTDCEYVLAGAGAMVRPASAEAAGYLHGAHGDLWRRLLPVLPRVRWVPAYRETARIDQIYKNRNYDIHDFSCHDKSELGRRSRLINYKNVSS